ncbi:beta-propeller domain-containing protein [Pseudoneobacillus sp. C159]
MRLKWMIPIGIFFLLIFSATIYFMTALKMESAWADSNDQLVVLPHKPWKFTFAEKLNQKYINDSNIYVTDAHGERVKVHLEYNENQKVLTVIPPSEGYRVKTKYTLFIDRKLQSVQGRELRKNNRFTFVVKETLPVVASKDELNEHFRKLIKEQKDNAPKTGTPVMEMAKDSAAEPSSSSKSSDFSETNNQVQGIDESDIIKTNGEYVFHAIDGKVKIIKAFPTNQMEVLEPLTFPSHFYPSQLFLHEDQLVVLGSKSEWMTKVAMDKMIAPSSQFTTAFIFDIKDPRNPEMVRQIEIEGSLVDARKKDGIIYLVSNYYPNYWILEEKKDADLRPKYKDSLIHKDYQEVNYRKIQYLPESKETNFTIISTFNLNNPDLKVNISTYLGAGNSLYMSENNIYLAVTNYPFMRTFQNSTLAPGTSIYKFSINRTNVVFESSTEISGTILNQFSMDEHNGYFRVATTEGSTWDEQNPSANHLLILDENLVEVGKVADLARGERIYSARFIGDRVYIVTFRETDPLFVIDAKDPKKPKVLGELKIPGFSNYLHPYDENYLIGFGQDTKVVDDGNGSSRVLTNGVKISLFDVSDMTNPQEKFSEIIGGRGSYSSLNHDHKALLFYKKENLFAFPISVYEGNEYEQKLTFQGGYIYRIDPLNGFKLQQRISHLDPNAVYEEWENSVQRLIYIGEIVYAISPNKMTAHRMKDLVQIGELPLK